MTWWSWQHHCHDHDGDPFVMLRGTSSTCYLMWPVFCPSKTTDQAIARALSRIVAQAQDRMVSPRPPDRRIYANLAVLVGVSNLAPNPTLLLRRCKGIGDFFTTIDGSNDHEKSTASNNEAQRSSGLVSFFICSMCQLVSSLRPWLLVTQRQKDRAYLEPFP